MLLPLPQPFIVYKSSEQGGGPMNVSLLNDRMLTSPVLGRSCGGYQSYWELRSVTTMTFLEVSVPHLYTSHSALAFFLPSFCMFSMGGVIESHCTWPFHSHLFPCPWLFMTLGSHCWPLHKVFLTTLIVALICEYKHSYLKNNFRTKFGCSWLLIPEHGR